MLLLSCQCIRLKNLFEPRNTKRVNLNRWDPGLRASCGPSPVKYPSPSLLMPHVNPVSWHCRGWLTFTEAYIRKISCPQCHWSQKSSNSKSVKSKMGQKLPAQIACLMSFNLPCSHIRCTGRTGSRKEVKTTFLVFWGVPVPPDVRCHSGYGLRDPISTGVEHTFLSRGCDVPGFYILVQTKSFPFFPRLLFPRK